MVATERYNVDGSKSMNLVFIGATQFGLRCLELVYTLSDFKVTGMVTAPRKFTISYRPEGVTNVLYADFASFAAKHDLPCRIIDDQGMKDSALFEAVKSWKPDAFLVVGWYHMIPKVWRKLAPAYGLHASLLPDYSGGAPLVWAMINGESQTGITLFQMDDGVDTGPIVAQTKVAIYERDTIATLYTRVEDKGIDLLKEMLPRLARGLIVPQPQPKTGRRVMPQRSPEDGLIDWTKDSRFIDRFVRAQTRPYPGAYTVLANTRVTVWSACSVDNAFPSFPAGFITHQDRFCFVQCGKGMLRLDEVEIDGKVFVSEQILRILPNGAAFEGLLNNKL